MYELAIVYAIPTYRRAHLIKQKTLALLDKYSIAPSDIYIFIADQDDEKMAYSQALGSHTYNVRYGPVGLHNMRNFIMCSFPPGTHMVCLDDDIDDLVFMKEDVNISERKSCKRYPLHSYPADYFKTWVQLTFKHMRDGPKLFGIYPVKNGYFMKSSPEITFDLRFCVGVFWGCIVDHDIRITCEEKEDVERTLLYYKKYGADSIMRFNHIAPVTTYYKTHGGMQASGIDRIQAAKESAAKLVATFPDLCSLKTSKKSGVYEVKLKALSAASYLKHLPHSLYWLPQ